MLGKFRVNYYTCNREGVRKIRSVQYVTRIGYSEFSKYWGPMANMDGLIEECGTFKYGRESFTLEELVGKYGDDPIVLRLLEYLS